MKGHYLLAYVYTLNNQTGVGSINMTMEEDQPITPEVIQDAIKVIRKNSGWDESVPVVALSWCRYEQAAKQDDETIKGSHCRNRRLCCSCDYFRATRNVITDIFMCSCSVYRKSMFESHVANVTPALMLMGNDI